MIRLARTRNRQPQFAVKIASSPLTRGLVFAALPGVTFRAQRNLVSQAKSIFDGVSSIKVEKSGLAAYISGSSASRLSFTSPLPYGDMTLIVVSAPYSISGNQCFLGVFNKVASNAIGNYISIESGQNYACVSTDGANWDVASGRAAVAGESVCLGASFASGGGRSLYINGALSGSSSNSRNPSGLEEIVLGCYYGGGGAGFTSPLTGSLSAALIFNRRLSPKEHAAIAANPWQIFKRRELLVGVGVTVQIARPIADLSNTGWVPSSGTDLHPMIGETVRDDGTYIGATVVGALCEVDLSDVGDPNLSTGHLPTLVLSAPGGGGITVRLRQGTTTIATWTYHPGTTPTEYTPALSGAEADSITDYTALRLQFEAVA